MKQLSEEVKYRRWKLLVISGGKTKIMIVALPLASRKCGKGKEGPRRREEGQKKNGVKRGRAGSYVVEEDEVDSRRPRKLEDFC